ncbi:hypothetical protein SDC9_54035 [bioreactor metagenome]|uniref:Uncharacterized protein n=1 Tax=bioreactor metagenome TaxID=1076179 RepID=A0A644WW70_9ZZZZ
MAATTSFAAVMRTDIPLIYRCEHCGQDVYMTYPLRTEYAWASPGSAVANSALRKQFEEKAGGAILEKMGKELAELDDNFNKQRMYYCLDGFISAGKCPHCKKKQTWRKLAGTGEEALAWAWLGALAGFLLGLAIAGVGLSLIPAINTTAQKLLVLLVISAVLLTIGIVAGKSHGKQLAASRKAKFEEWFAHAPKEQIPRLLVEQRSTPRFIDTGLRGMYDM